MNAHTKILWSVVAIALGMLALSFASVPLYRIFCTVTGFGGTPRIAVASPGMRGERTLTVRFDANTAPNLPWKFKPQQASMRVRTGENIMAFYEVENHSDKALTGMAVYNVTPDTAGAYFNKIHCFCFDEQLLEPGEKMLLPVSFFLDPALEKDPNLRTVDTITLSYTFFHLKK